MQIKKFGLLLNENGEVVQHNYQEKKGDVQLKHYENHNGEVIERTSQQQKEEISNTLKQEAVTEYTPEKFEKQLTDKLGMIQIIKSKMTEGLHYMTIPASDKPFLTQPGANLLLSATKASTEYEIIKERINHELGFISYVVKCKIYWSDGTLAGEDIGTANSHEETIRKQFATYDAKTNSWKNKPGKSVWGSDHNILTKSRKRAKVAAARQIFAITGVFDEEHDNPKANKNTQQALYREFYKLFLEFAPKAPTKKKQKNGKWKQFDAKEQLKWRKDFVRTTILHERLLNLGLPYYDWGVQDIETVKKLFPTWLQEIKEAENAKQK